MDRCNEMLYVLFDCYLISSTCLYYKEACTPLQKSANGIPLNTIEYHWIPLSTVGPFNGISAGLCGILNGNLRYHSIPLNDTLNTKYH